MAIGRYLYGLISQAFNSIGLSFLLHVEHSVPDKKEVSYLDLQHCENEIKKLREGLRRDHDFDVLNNPSDYRILIAHYQRRWQYITAFLGEVLAFLFLIRYPRATSLERDLLAISGLL